MNWVHPIALILATWLAAFAQASFGGVRTVLGVQPDLLPALVVYAALNMSLSTTTAVALIGGFGGDAMSAGPFGLGVVIPVVLGVLLHHRRELVLRDSAWAQALLGGAASLAVGLGGLGLLFVFWPFLSASGAVDAFAPEALPPGAVLPVVGFGLLGRLAILAGLGAAATPGVFLFFGWIKRTLDYRPVADSAYRMNREIKRGRF